MGRIQTIFNAAKDGNLEHLIKNIEKHVDVNAIDKDGYTPAHIAVASLAWRASGFIG